MSLTADPKPTSITAVILAGGFGTRLRSAVPDLPKVLAPIHGRPFLSYLLHQLEQSGVRETVLCTGYCADQVEQTFGPRFGSLTLAYSREQSPLGTGGALRKALTLVHSDIALVCNGDSYVEFDLPTFLQSHRSHSAVASVLLTQVENTARFGRVERNERDEIIQFAEKGGDASRGWINAGVYLIERSAIAEIPEHRAVSIEREVFPALIGRGLFGFAGGGRFLDIGTPESYAAAEAFFAHQNVQGLGRSTR